MIEFANLSTSDDSAFVAQFSPIIQLRTLFYQPFVLSCHVAQDDLKLQIFPHQPPGAVITLQVCSVNNSRYKSPVWCSRICYLGSLWHSSILLVPRFPPAVFSQFYNLGRTMIDYLIYPDFIEFFRYECIKMSCKIFSWTC